MSLISAFLQKIQTILGTKTQTIGGTFLTFQAQLSYDYFENPDLLIGHKRPDLSLACNPFFDNSPSYKLTPQTILRYIQFIDSIHDFGKGTKEPYAYDKMDYNKTTQFYNFTNMLLSFILRTSFPTIPKAIPNLVEPANVAHQKMDIIPYCNMTMSYIEQQKNSVTALAAGEVEPHILLLAMQYCKDQGATNGGSFRYVKLKDAGGTLTATFDDFWDFFNEEYS